MIGKIGAAKYGHLNSGGVRLKKQLRVCNES